MIEWEKKHHFDFHIDDWFNLNMKWIQLNICYTACVHIYFACGLTATTMKYTDA